MPIRPPRPADGRFAPSPTGPLHLGNLRTALLAWRFARAQGARFLIRMEDLDTPRVRPGAEAQQLADLAALGIDWDGPVVRQSERGALYEDALARLEAAGALYPCFCTRAEILEAASAPQEGQAEGAYPGTCAHLSAAERAARLAAGRPPALRFRAGGTEVEVRDLVLGARTFLVDDPVVRRNDGAVAYNLAVVVDDAEQAIGEVVRGEDLLASTARQILIARALGVLSPRWAHVPLLTGPDGVRLAKRHGAVTLAERAALGERPAQVRDDLLDSVAPLLERFAPEDAG